MAAKTFRVLAPILYGEPDGTQHHLRAGQTVTLDADSDTARQLLATDTIEDPANPKKRDAAARVALEIRNELAGTLVPENAAAAAAERARNRRTLEELGLEADKGR